MNPSVLAETLEVVADECQRVDPLDPFSADAVALHAAALRASTETVRLAARIERARARRLAAFRRLLRRRPGQRR